jgi:hypothetical protein
MRDGQLLFSIVDATGFAFTPRAAAVNDRWLATGNADGSSEVRAPPEAAVRYATPGGATPVSSLELRPRPPPAAVFYSGIVPAP